MAQDFFLDKLRYFSVDYDIYTSREFNQYFPKCGPTIPSRSLDAYNIVYSLTTSNTFSWSVVTISTMISYLNSALKDPIKNANRHGGFDSLPWVALIFNVSKTFPCLLCSVTISSSILKKIEKYNRHMGDGIDFGIKIVGIR